MNTITHGHKVAGLGIEPIPPYTFKAVKIDCVRLAFWPPVDCTHVCVCMCDLARRGAYTYTHTTHAHTQTLTPHPHPSTHAHTNPAKMAEK